MARKLTLRALCALYALIILLIPDIDLVATNMRFEISNVYRLKKKIILQRIEH